MDDKQYQPFSFPKLPNTAREKPHNYARVVPMSIYANQLCSQQSVVSYQNFNYISNPTPSSRGWP